MPMTERSSRNHKPIVASKIKDNFMVEYGSLRDDFNEKMKLVLKENSSRKAPIIDYKLESNPKIFDNKEYQPQPSSKKPLEESQNQVFQKDTKSLSPFHNTDKLQERIKAVLSYH